MNPRLRETNAMDIGSVGDELCMEGRGRCEQVYQMLQVRRLWARGDELGHAQRRWTRVERIGAEERQGT